MILYVVVIYIPNNRKDGSNGKKEKSCYKHAAVILLFHLTELALAVIGVSLMPRSAHRDKGKHDVSKHEADAYKRPFATDVQHTGKKRH